jgi:hypothetical protein
MNDRGSGEIARPEIEYFRVNSLLEVWMLRAKTVVFLLALLVAGAGILTGQSFTAALRGVVTDPSGAAVAAAKITVTEADRNVSRTVFTDEAGRYVAPN